MNKFLAIGIMLIGFIFVSTIPNVFSEPELFDNNLILEEYISDVGWGYTTMTFVDKDILLLQKTGFVNVIRDGIIQKEPILEIPVNPIRESGLLGITSVDSTVYIYFTEIDQDDEQSGNRIYKYDWDGNALINPILVKELPSNEYHNGGAMVTGLDDQVYAVIGDTGKYGPLQNKPLEDLYPPGISDYMDTSVILQVEPEGEYYAMGIRNSFGLAIDPVSGNLWATENGDDDFDEINLIFDKFNSGWESIMGPATETELMNLQGYQDYIYSDPEFSWVQVVAPAGINFGKFKETTNYDNSLFVGDCNNGNLYKFELNHNRDGFEFSSLELQDNIVNENDSMTEIIIGSGFGCITDIERGPDGFLYLISHGERAIHRILPVEAAIPDESNQETISNTFGGGCLIATATFGSEMAPQVQFLREIRDNKVLTTSSGESFMESFNQFYYSFSPYVADYERENPLFKEAVKLGLTPMLSTLSVLSVVDIDSEQEMLGYGIGVILMNIGIYFAAPATIIYSIIKKTQLL